MVQLGVQQATVADLLAQGTTNLNAVPYLQEDTLTNAATTVAEGGTKPEATWDWSQTSAPVKKIAVISKVSDELFADVPTIESYINQRLRYMVEITEDTQLLLGDGTGSNITGIENTSGIQTQARSADSQPDAIRKAMTKIQSVGFFAPDGVVLHPTDWETIQLLKDDNGQYLAGGPFYAPYGNGQYVMFYRLWGLPVVVTTSQTVGTALVGAFKLGAMIFRRQGLSIDSTNSNEDDFKKNLVALRAEERLALAVWRPKAFATVTGL
jgi:HK97 family phage major capsid protein